MSYYDGFDKGFFPCGESYFDKQQFDCFDKKPFDGFEKTWGGCCIDKKFLMECELRCKPFRPRPCPPKPKCFPFAGCFCVTQPPRKDWY